MKPREATGKQETTIQGTCQRRRRRGLAVLDETVGDRELCAWLVEKGVVWIQTRRPEYARKLSRRADSHLVAYSVAGEYWRTFEIPKPLAWARGLIARYQTACDKVTNEPFKGASAPLVASDTQGKVITAARLRSAFPGTKTSQTAPALERREAA